MGIKIPFFSKKSSNKSNKSSNKGKVKPVNAKAASKVSRRSSASRGKSKNSSKPMLQVAAEKSLSKKRTSSKSSSGRRSGAKPRTTRSVSTRSRTNARTTKARRSGVKRTTKRPSNRHARSNQLSYTNASITSIDTSYANVRRANSNNAANNRNSRRSTGGINLRKLGKGALRLATGVLTLGTSRNTRQNNNQTNNSTGGISLRRLGKGALNLAAGVLTLGTSRNHRQSNNQTSNRSTRNSTGGNRTRGIASILPYAGKLFGGLLSGNRSNNNRPANNNTRSTGAASTNGKNILSSLRDKLIPTTYAAEVPSSSEASDASKMTSSEKKSREAAREAAIYNNGGRDLYNRYMAGDPDAIAEVDNYAELKTHDPNHGTYTLADFAINSLNSKDSTVALVAKMVANEKAGNYLKNRETYQKNNDELVTLSTRLGELETTFNANGGRGTRSQINEYNRGVERYNSLIEDQKTLSNSLNSYVGNYHDSGLVDNSLFKENNKPIVQDRKEVTRQERLNYTDAARKRRNMLERKGSLENKKKLTKEEKAELDRINTIISSSQNRNNVYGPPAPNTSPYIKYLKIEKNPNASYEEKKAAIEKLNEERAGQALYTNDALTYIAKKEGIWDSYNTTNNSSMNPSKNTKKSKVSTFLTDTASTIVSCANPTHMLPAKIAGTIYGAWKNSNDFYGGLDNNTARRNYKDTIKLAALQTGASFLEVGDSLRDGFLWITRAQTASYGYDSALTYEKLYPETGYKADSTKIYNEVEKQMAEMVVNTEPSKRITNLNSYQTALEKAYFPGVALAMGNMTGDAAPKLLMNAHPATRGLIFLSGYGRGAEIALRSGATPSDADIYGFGSGALEQALWKLGAKTRGIQEGSYALKGGKLINLNTLTEEELVNFSGKNLFALSKTYATGGRVLSDSLMGASYIPADSLLAALSYKGDGKTYTYIDENGQEIQMHGSSSFIENYLNAYEQSGGNKALLESTLLAGGLSTAAEMGPLAKQINAMRRGELPSFKNASIGEHSNITGINTKYNGFLNENIAKLDSETLNKGITDPAELKEDLARSLEESNQAKLAEAVKNADESDIVNYVAANNATFKNAYIDSIMKNTLAGYINKSKNAANIDKNFNLVKQELNKKSINYLQPEVLKSELIAMLEKRNLTKEVEAIKRIDANDLSEYFIKNSTTAENELALYRILGKGFDMGIGKTDMESFIKSSMLAKNLSPEEIAAIYERMKNTNELVKVIKDQIGSGKNKVKESDIKDVLQIINRYVKNGDENGFRSNVKLNKGHQFLLREWTENNQLRGVVEEALSEKIYENFGRKNVISSKDASAASYKAVMDKPLPVSGYQRSTNYRRVDSIFNSKNQEQRAKLQVKNIGTSKYIRGNKNEPITFRGKTEVVGDIGKNIVKNNTELNINKVKGVDTLMNKSTNSDNSHLSNKSLQNENSIKTDDITTKKVNIDRQSAEEAVALTGTASVENMNSFTLAQKFGLSDGIGETQPNGPIRENLRFKKTNDFLKNNEKYKRSFGFAKKHVDTVVDHYERHYQPFNSDAVLEQVNLNISTDEIYIVDTLIGKTIITNEGTVKSARVYHSFDFSVFPEAHVDYYKNSFYLSLHDLEIIEKNPVFANAVLTKMKESEVKVLMEKANYVKTVMDTYYYFKFSTKNLLKKFNNNQTIDNASIIENVLSKIIFIDGFPETVDPYAMGLNHNGFILINLKSETSLKYLISTLIHEANHSLGNLINYSLDKSTYSNGLGFNELATEAISRLLFGDKLGTGYPEIVNPFIDNILEEGIISLELLKSEYYSPSGDSTKIFNELKHFDSTFDEREFSKILDNLTKDEYQGFFDRYEDLETYRYLLSKIVKGYQESLSIEEIAQRKQHFQDELATQRNIVNESELLAAQIIDDIQIENLEKNIDKYITKAENTHYNFTEEITGAVHISGEELNSVLGVPHQIFELNRANTDETVHEGVNLDIDDNPETIEITFENQINSDTHITNPKISRSIMKFGHDRWLDNILIEDSIVRLCQKNGINPNNLKVLGNHKAVLELGNNNWILKIGPNYFNEFLDANSVERSGNLINRPIASALIDERGIYRIDLVERLDTSTITKQDVLRMHCLLRDRGILWTDLKTSNLGRDKNGNIKLLDYGQVYDKEVNPREFNEMSSEKGLWSGLFTREEVNEFYNEVHRGSIPSRTSGYPENIEPSKKPSIQNKIDDILYPEKYALDLTSSNKIKKTSSYKRALSDAKKRFRIARRFYRGKTIDELGTQGAKQFDNIINSKNINPDELRIVDIFYSSDYDRRTFEAIKDEAGYMDLFHKDALDYYNKNFYLKASDIELMLDNPIFTEAVLESTSKSLDLELRRNTELIKNSIKTYQYFKYCTSKVMQGMLEKNGQDLERFNEILNNLVFVKDIYLDDFAVSKNYGSGDLIVVSAKNADTALERLVYEINSSFGEEENKILNGVLSRLMYSNKKHGKFDPADIFADELIESGIVSLDTLKKDYYGGTNSWNNTISEIKKDFYSEFNDKKFMNIVKHLTDEDINDVAYLYYLGKYRAAINDITKKYRATLSESEITARRQQAQKELKKQRDEIEKLEADATEKANAYQSEKLKEGIEGYKSNLGRTAALSLGEIKDKLSGLRILDPPKKAIHGAKTGVKEFVSLTIDGMNEFRKDISESLSRSKETMDIKSENNKLQEGEPSNKIESLDNQDTTDRKTDSTREESNLGEDDEIQTISDKKVEEPEPRPVENEDSLFSPTKEEAVEPVTAENKIDSTEHKVEKTQNPEQTKVFEQYAQKQVEHLNLQKELFSRKYFNDPGLIMPIINRSYYSVGLEHQNNQSTYQFFTGEQFTPEKIEALNNAILETNRKYGNKQATEATTKYLRNNDSRYFTNEKNVRTRLNNEFSDRLIPSDDIINEGIVQDYVNDLINIQNEEVNIEIVNIIQSNKQQTISIIKEYLKGGNVDELINKLLLKANIENPELYREKLKQMLESLKLTGELDSLTDEQLIEKLVNINETAN